MENKVHRSKGGRAAAWAVHAITASGVVLALLALDAVLREQWHGALLWLFAALAVDGVDGTLARAANVKEHTPRIDGDALDLVIDYLTYVFVPALIIWRIGVLPDVVALPLTALILVSSLYVFGRRDMKTGDGYFRGFPALWNVVAFYFVVAPPEPALAAGVVGAFVVLTFAPVHVPHPFRARAYGLWLPAAALTWAASSATLLLPRLDDTIRASLLGISLAAAGVLIALGLLRTARGEGSA